MTFWIANILAVLIISIVSTGIIIPQILLISFRRKLFDEPDERKIHTSSVPRLGGLAFMPVVFFATVLTLAVDLRLDPSLMVTQIEPNAGILAFLACGVLMLYISGMAHDLVGVRYRAKFVAQILAAIFLVASGVSIDNFCGILGLNEISLWAAVPFTILVSVFIINSVNLIDGIDGLASGLMSIACLCYGVVYFMLDQYIYSMLAFAVMGVLMPFFYYNVFGDPNKQKKIFMGDTGSLTIGMMVTFLSVHLVQIQPTGLVSEYNMAVIAFVPLLIPCFDVVRVYGERILNHSNPFLPDKRHIHHKLLQIGMSQSIALVTIVLVSLIFTVSNVILSEFINVNILLVIDMVVWMASMLGINRVIIAKLRREGWPPPSSIDK